MDEIQKKKIMTVKEALDEGFTKYGYEYDGWQSVKELAEIQENEDHERTDLLLFSKELTYPSIDPYFIADLLADSIADYDYEESGRDDSLICDTVKKIDFTTMAETINKKLKEECSYYMLTDVKVVFTGG